MKITGIIAQQHNKNRVNVMVDGKFRFSLDIYQIADLGIKIGVDYTDNELHDLENESQFGKLYARTLEYCLMRPHSAKEVRDYLYRKTLTKRYKSRTGEIKEREGVSKRIVDRVFERLVSKGYVDDEKFTKFWVENRNQRKGASLRKLRAELLTKGVSQSLIESVLSQTNRNDQTELLKVLAKKRTKYNDDERLMRYLAGQGFSYDAIKAALNETSG